MHPTQDALAPEALIPDAFTLTSDQLDAYLDRIGIAHRPAPDLAGLRQLHHAHLMGFTFEALDAFMGWPSGFTPTAAFQKMVVGGRGGWCFEMNGLFGAALSALGFRVTRLCAAVNRELIGDVAIGNHLTLRVDLDRPYLAEVGVADAIVAPVPMVPGPIRQRGFDFSITPIDAGWLRFHNHPQGIARSFDLHPEHGGEAAMIAAHGWLMHDPASPFTNALAVLRHDAAGYLALQNDRLRRVTAEGTTEERVTGAAHLGEVLESRFHLRVPQPDAVWARIEATRAKTAA